MVDKIAENGIVPGRKRKPRQSNPAATTVLPTETMEGEVAKKDQEQQIKYYESVREHSLAMSQKAEEAIQQLKTFGDDFVDVFEKTAKRHTSLLNKVAKLVERDRKKFEGSAKRALTKVKKVKAVKKVKPLPPEPKPPAAKKPSSVAKPEILQ